ncbi:7,8-dihydropterin-6-yl-methyl-4-(beta-D-ribofuranosyl)aminobenzene 5'-phosphate synthase [Oxalobacteraceae bacterium GrIS 2.11]
MKTILAYCCLVLSSLLMVSNATAAAAANAPATNVKVTILSTMLADSGIGEWGFAALVEVDGNRVLFDTGARPETVLQNAKELKIDLSQVTDVVLTHFHSDHVGGLMTLRNAMMLKNPKALSRVHVGEGIFEPRYAQNGKDNINPMLAIRKEYEASGGVFIIHREAQQIFPAVWLTGPVKRRYDERNWSKEAWVAGESGHVEDTIKEDMSMIVKGADGMIVITGCGHAGIGNILAQVQELVPDTKVHAVIGGLHLFAANEKKLAWTAEKMREAGVQYLLAAHCTGLEATYRLRALLKLDRKAAVVAAVGSSYSNRTGIDPLDLAR